MTPAKKSTAKKSQPKEAEDQPRTVELDETTLMRVAVLDTHVGEPLFVRSNPDEEAVQAFVKEHNRRYQAGEPAGHHGENQQPAYLITKARFFPSEAAYYENREGGTLIKLDAQENS